MRPHHPCPSILTLAHRSLQDKLLNPLNCLQIPPWSCSFQHHQTPQISLSWHVDCAPVMEKKNGNFFLLVYIQYVFIIMKHFGAKL